MIAHLLAGIVAIALYGFFLGTMLVWVPAPPLIMVVAIVSAMMLYDFVQTMRFGEEYGRRDMKR